MQSSRPPAHRGTRARSIPSPERRWWGSAHRGSVAAWTLGWTMVACWIGCSAAPAEPAPAPVIPIAPVASAATSSATVESAEPAAPVLQLAVLDAARWVASGPTGDAGRWHLSYRFEGERYTTTAYPPWEESGRVELVEVDGRRMLLRFSDRVYDGQPDSSVRRWIELAEDDQSFRMGDQRFEREPLAATVAAEPAETASPL
ncbi:MAG: hypothetical protein JRI68_00380 [Deltaproteobacteria bacterium]|nr:hypothetical protein [Deltaproteobacteria bacterium]